MPNGGLKNINMDQINREHILAAIQEIDREGIRPGRNSSTYDVIHEGKPYPPKLVISIANRFATGEELDSSIFSGGIDTPAFQLLKKEGFEIVNKGDSISNLINVKDEFVNWFISNDGKISNYFSKQFGAKKERLVDEFNLYEVEYKENFNTELFVVDAGNYKNQIERIKNNIYDKNANFSNYSKERSNDRPRAILGNNNYIKFLQEKFNPKKYSNDEENFTASVEENNALVYMQSNKEPLNQILYGPPGTGKTYNTINRSLSILEGRSQKEINLEARIDLKTRFDDYVKNGQIVFTTFHQSMSYEDFIEGIKPETKHEKVIYNVQDGILKKIIKTALIEYLEKGNNSDKEDSFDSLYKEYVNSIRSFEGKREGLFTTKTGVEIMLVDANDNSILVKYIWGDKKKGQEGKQVFTVSKEKLKKTLFEGIVPANVKNLKEQLHPLIGHIHCELFAVYKHFYDFVVTNKGEIDAVHYDYEDLSFKEVKEQYDLLDTKTLNNKVVKPYIIIIDEINRGNVSGIFGELITLIEDDKRLGKREALEVTLPYSKDRFGVPDNLFIIGTMNTADRSVEALDTALRRRFSFSEMMPKRELLQKIQFKGFNLAEVLKTINERIEVLLDRDHTIGHSYFLKIKNGDIESLKSVFKNNIFPLLQEYFYHDYEKIALILGEGFVRVKENQTVNFAKFKNIDAPEVSSQFELIDKIVDIEAAVHLLLNRNV